MKLALVRPFIVVVLSLLSCHQQKPASLSEPAASSGSSTQDISASNPALYLIPPPISVAKDLVLPSFNVTAQKFLGDYFGMNITIPDLNLDYDYIEFQVCQKSGDPCYTDQFVNNLTSYPNPIVGAVSVRLRACVLEGRVANASENCGPWTAPKNFFQVANPKDKLAIAQSEYAVYKRMASACRNYLNDLANYQKTAKDLTPEVAGLIHNQLVTLSPPFCALVISSSVVAPFMGDPSAQSSGVLGKVAAVANVTIPIMIVLGSSSIILGVGAFAYGTKKWFLRESAIGAILVLADAIKDDLTEIRSIQVEHAFNAGEKYYIAYLNTVMKNNQNRNIRESVLGGYMDGVEKANPDAAEAIRRVVNRDTLLPLKPLSDDRPEEARKYLEEYSKNLIKMQEKIYEIYTPLSRYTKWFEFKFTNKGHVWEMLGMLKDDVDRIANSVKTWEENGKKPTNSEMSQKDKDRILELKTKINTALDTNEVVAKNRSNYKLDEMLENHGTPVDEYLLEKAQPTLGSGAGGLWIKAGLGVAAAGAVAATVGVAANSLGLVGEDAMDENLQKILQQHYAQMILLRNEAYNLSHADNALEQ